eukprot:NODE_11054_length_1311_cov_3.856419.p1 GENE.NODE_11054_length_1311_cov_3.856419~~NODE_11054_length_1311_cov_3.856419.p1  ORF type:complete len:289 (+),score=58.87 NODE_11054_length_1311_cov_3.856419:57-869(+)
MSLPSPVNKFDITRSGHQARLSMDSQLEYASVDQTIIIFDWDDTICPSSWLRFSANETRFTSEGRAGMSVLSYRARALLQLAESLGKVVFVTNARRPWVEHSCGDILPGLRQHMKRLPVLYAIELVPPIPVEMFSDVGRDARDELLTTSKARAMEGALTEFYSRYPNQSWKNVVSIGDAYFEHDAVKQVVSGRPLKDDPTRRCRCKTIKLLEGPTLNAMVLELTLVERLLLGIIQHDENVDIDLEANQAELNGWVAQFAAPLPPNNTDLV